MKLNGTCSTPLDEFYLASSSSEKQLAGEKLTESVCRLLGVNVPWRGLTFSTFEILKTHLAWELEKALDREPTLFSKQKMLELLEFLVTDRQSPFRSLVEDLGEITLLEREKRSEYVGSPRVSPPYRIRKLLLEYACFSLQIDEIIGNLTKDFCAQSCERLPVGCCRVLGYDLGLVPDVMLEAQVAEADLKGWERPPLNRERCQFHTATGCVISMFKTPACIGFLCDELVALLGRTYPPLIAAEFVAALTEFRNQDIDRKKVFETMQKTVKTGKKLLGYNPRFRSLRTGP